MAKAVEDNDASEYGEDRSVDDADEGSISLGPLSLAESNSEYEEDYLDEGGHLDEEDILAENDLEKRLLHPVEYFKELDDLGSKIFDRSMFPFLINGVEHRPFDGTVRFVAPFLENATFQRCTFSELLSFCNEVAGVANLNASNLEISAHYSDHQMYHHQIEQLTHLIECRNIISAAWQSVMDMKSADYCGSFISVLILDNNRLGVARLVRIECDMIEKAANDFEMCLYQALSCEPVMILQGVLDTFINDVTAACGDLFIKIGITIPNMDSKDLWRCAVHVLDAAVLLYAGAHTQFPGHETINTVTLPGYFQLSRRPFSCLSAFLGGQEAWILELHYGPVSNPPPLYLSTDAETFGDIWGPMWMSCALGNKEQIIQYNVGNGVIVPWQQPNSDSHDAVPVRKGEILCHWMSDNEHDDEADHFSPSTMRESDIILIGAPVRLVENDACKASLAKHRQRLQNSGALTELGTMKLGRKLDSETVQIQVAPPSIGFGYQRNFKKRNQNWKNSLIETWKNSPSSRHVGYLTVKLGLEVSSCTLNARRIMLIDLFRSKTMLNHLQNVSPKWTSKECEEGFYSALQSEDKTAFYRLYKDRPDWQADFGNAIDCCFDALKETGEVEKNLVLFWAPDAEPGQKVTLRSNELSWIGFLEDNESSGSLAVLEESCLELPEPGIGGKCMWKSADPVSTRENHPGIDERPVLETKVFLNESIVPISLRDARMRSKRRDGKMPEYTWHWSLKSLEEGDKFDFGDKGILKTIRKLHHGQVLAEWSESPYIKHHFRTILSSIPVFGRVFAVPPLCHVEWIRNSKEDTNPVSFVILSNCKPTERHYHVDPSRSGQPRSMTAQVKTELQKTLYRWIHGPTILVNGQRSG